jgi:CheY-like chemotaxis protein
MDNVLLIDDDEDDRELFSCAVHEINSTVHCTTIDNAEDALRRLSSLMSEKPDIIFLDLKMPRMTGLQFLRELKQDYLLKDIPIVIYTSAYIEGDINLALHFGAIDYITKPSSFPKICDAIMFFIKTPLEAQ